jgi:hypothetical protein
MFEDKGLRSEDEQAQSQSIEIELQDHVVGSIDEVREGAG